MALVGAVRRASSRPCIVLDIDDTLLFRRPAALGEVLRLYLGSPGSASRVGTAFPSAVQAVQDASRSFDIIFLTARWQRAAAHTARWLAEAGLPAGAVHHSHRPHPGDASRIAFKAGVIEQLRAEGMHPVLGVGDRPSDLLAYTAAGCSAWGVCHLHPELPPAAAVAGVCAHMQQLTRVVQAHGLADDTTLFTDSWNAIARGLTPLRPVSFRLSRAHHGALRGAPAIAGMQTSDVRSSGAFDGTPDSSYARLHVHREPAAEADSAHAWITEGGVAVPGNVMDAMPFLALRRGIAQPRSRPASTDPGASMPSIWTQLGGILQKLQPAEHTEAAGR